MYRKCINTQCIEHPQCRRIGKTFLNYEGFESELSFMSTFSPLYLQEIVQNVEAESQNPYLKEYDCYVMAILSHGNRGVIYGMDTERVSVKIDFC